MPTFVDAFGNASGHAMFLGSHPEGDHLNAIAQDHPSHRFDHCQRCFFDCSVGFAFARPRRRSGPHADHARRGKNYRPGAPIVERIGGGGFWMSGTVRRAGDGAPLPNRRIQIWAHTTEGHERDQRSHGATLTDASGAFRLEMPQIVPAFGQPHGHLAYDDDAEFKTVFLRPIMPSASDTSLAVDFVLEPV